MAAESNSCWVEQAKQKQGPVQFEVEYTDGIVTRYKVAWKDEQGIRRRRLYEVNEERAARLEFIKVCTEAKSHRKQQKLERKARAKAHKAAAINGTYWNSTQVSSYKAAAGHDARDDDEMSLRDWNFSG